MAENDGTTPPADDKGTNPGTGGDTDTTDWKVEAEKWKALSRKHENEEKALKVKLAEKDQASMSEAEKAIAAAKEEGAKSVLSKVNERLAKAELKAAAAEAGVSLPDVKALKLDVFVNEDGEPNDEAIAEFIKSLKPVKGKKSEFADPKDLGIGPQHGDKNAGKVKQYTREDLKNMTHKERVEARAAGHLNDLLSIE